MDKPYEALEHARQALKFHKKYDVDWSIFPAFSVLLGGFADEIGYDQ